MSAATSSPRPALCLTAMALILLPSYSHAQEVETRELLPDSIITVGYARGNLN